jgi:Peptidase family M23
MMKVALMNDSLDRRLVQYGEQLRAAKLEKIRVHRVQRSFRLSIAFALCIALGSGVCISRLHKQPRIPVQIAGPTLPPDLNGLRFPVLGDASFVDTFGAPRMTGTKYEHLHEGIDIFALKGSPLIAIEDGTIERLGVAILGGNELWLHSENGTLYQYAHLDKYPDGLANGAKVFAGQIIGYVGTSGNAEGTPAHVHFEWHPDGAAAINPYPQIKKLKDVDDNLSFRANAKCFQNGDQRKARELPDWMRGGFSGTRPKAPFVTSVKGQIGAILLANLQVNPKGHSNKILWVSKPKVTRPDDLRIIATSDDNKVVTRIVPGGPGPSIIDLPSEGCWRLDLAWSGNHDTIGLRYTK